MNNLEEEINKLGISFRNLVQHSDNEWTCAFFYNKEKQKYKYDGRGNSPLEAVQDALNMYEALRVKHNRHE